MAVIYNFNLIMNKKNKHCQCICRKLDNLSIIRMVMVRVNNFLRKIKIYLAVDQILIFIHFSFTIEYEFILQQIKYYHLELVVFDLSKQLFLFKKKNILSFSDIAQFNLIIFKNATMSFSWGKKLGIFSPTLFLFISQINGNNLVITFLKYKKKLLLKLISNLK